MSEDPASAPPPRRAGSIALRLAAAALVSTLIAVTAGGFALSHAFHRSVEAAFDQRLEALHRALVAALRVGRDGAIGLDRGLGDPRFDQIFSGWYWQVEEVGQEGMTDEVVLASRSLWDQTLDVAGTPGSGPAAVRQIVDGPTEGVPLRLVARTITLPDHDGPLVVAVAADAAEIGLETRRFDRLLILMLGGLVLVATLLTLVQLRWGLAPLRRLSGDLDAIRAGRAARLDEQRPREVLPLVRAMNGVLDHDAEVVRRARAQAGNLAHGLKTPLTLLAADIADLPEDRREVARRQIDAMRLIVERHLTRASAAANAAVIGARTPVAPVAADIARSLERMFARRDPPLSIAVDLAPDLESRGELDFRGERQDLEEILGNLMENACKWAAGRVRVSGGAASGDMLLILIEDDGPGLTPDQARAALQRGRRLDERVPGSGLGLSIVSDVVEIYGGTLALAASDGLGGLAARVTLPRAEENGRRRR
ncbi:sensor histidine kinase [Tistrella mobilis]